MGECLIVRRGGEVKALPVLNAGLPANGSLVAGSGDTLTLSVAIATPGVPAAYTYQWYKNGTAIPNATGSSYTATAEAAVKTDSYYCVVTNKAGAVQSRTATVALTVPTGDTATPLNNTNTWLLCASINPGDYGNPSLAAVVGNSTLCTALMNSNNAVKYMIRSTAIQTAVLGSSTALTSLDNSSPLISPAMTGGSAPEGYTAISQWGSGAYVATTDSIYYATQSGTSGWAGIKLPYPVWPYRLQGGATGNKEGTYVKKFQASNDGTNWTDISDPLSETVSGNGTPPIKNYTPFSTAVCYQYFRLLYTSRPDSGQIRMRGIKVYGKRNG